jgi:hypothetical protein
MALNFMILSLEKQHGNDENGSEQFRCILNDRASFRSNRGNYDLVFSVNVDTTHKLDSLLASVHAFDKIAQQLKVTRDNSLLLITMLQMFERWLPISLPQLS